MWLPVVVGMVVYVSLFVALVVSALSTLYVHVADVLVSLALVAFPSNLEERKKMSEKIVSSSENRTGKSDQGGSLFSSRLQPNASTLHLPAVPVAGLLAKLSAVETRDTACDPPWPPLLP